MVKTDVQHTMNVKNLNKRLYEETNYISLCKASLFVCLNFGYILKLSLL